MQPDSIEPSWVKGSWHVFKVKKELKENDLPDMLQQMYNDEFTECHYLVNKDVAGMSQED